MFGSIISWKAYFETHIVYVKRLVLGALRRFKLFVPLYNLGNLYNSHAPPYFDYCYPLWDTCGKQLKDKLQKIQNRAGRVITGSSYDIRSVDVLIFLCNFFFAYKTFPFQLFCPERSWAACGFRFRKVCVVPRPPSVKLSQVRHDEFMSFNLLGLWGVKITIFCYLWDNSIAVRWRFCKTMLLFSKI